MTENTNENTCGKRFKIALALLAIATFVWTYVACNNQDDMSSQGNNIVKTEMQPTRVYDLKERSIPHNLFGQEAKEACEQNDKRFSPVYDTKTDTCHLTVKEPTVQTIKNLRNLLNHCLIGFDELSLKNRNLKTYEKLDGTCRTDNNQKYKTELTFKKPISFNQDIVNQCKKMKNCTCDENAKCTLFVHDYILAEENHEFETLGEDAPHNLDLSSEGIIITRTEKLKNNTYQVDIAGVPLKTIYDNVETIKGNDEYNSCRLYCYKHGRMIPKAESAEQMISPICGCKQR